MAKIVSTTTRKPFDLKNTTSKLDSTYKSQLESRYSIFLEGRPTFVTFYTQNKISSTSDLNLKGTVELIGSESATRYNKILDFPIYGIDQINFDSELDQYGNDVSQISGEILSLPKTIKPSPDDIIVLEDYRDQFFIRITDVTASHVEGKSFFKISYQLIYPEEEIEAQVDDDYITDFSKIGAEGSSPIYKLSVSEYTDFLLDVVHSLLDIYTSKYMKDGLLIFNDSNNYLIDIFLHRFIQKSKLFESYKYRSSKIVYNPNEFNRIDQYQVTISYNQSIFSMLENSYDNEIIIDKLAKQHIFIPYIPTAGDVLFYNPTIRPLQISSFVENTSDIVSSDSLSVITVISDEFINRLETNDVNITLTNLELMLYKLISDQYLPGERTDSEGNNITITTTDAISTLIEDLNDSFLLEESNSYWLLPVILFKVKQHIELYHSGV